ncbi:MAG TPA: FAD-binding oxidoreductase [Kofleriaceae bacterium]
MSLRAALAAWRRIVGRDHVVTDPGALDDASTATYQTRPRVRAIVRPAGVAEVQACVRVAQSRRVPIYPVSRGCNWGYGSRVPPEDATLFDLRRMNRIVAFDPALAYVTVEPGVTVGQLAAFLRRRRAPLRISLTGSSPDASLVGNALERGLGNGIDFDRFANTCELEVVLADGTLLHTGWAGYASARAAHTFPGALGPSLSGLFAQSSFGIVTRMTIWLWPESRHREILRFGVDDPARLASLLDRLRDLLLERSVRGCVTFASDLRVLARHIQYPWDLAPRPPLPAAVRASLRSAGGLSRWNGSIVLETASPELARLERRVVRERIAPAVDRFTVVRNVGHDIVDPTNLRTVYWRKRTPPPAVLDPDRDRCGVIWHNAMVPLRGAEVVRALSVAERILERHGFEPMLAIALCWPRAAHLTALLLYDREAPGADRRALACSRALATRWARHGWLPYRLGIHDMPVAARRIDDGAAAMRRLRAALDPAGVLAPGRYEPAGR